MGWVCHTTGWWCLHYIQTTKIAYSAQALHCRWEVFGIYSQDIAVRGSCDSSICKQLSGDRMPNLLSAVAGSAKISLPPGKQKTNDNYWWREGFPCQLCEPSDVSPTKRRSTSVWSEILRGFRVDNFSLWESVLEQLCFGSGVLCLCHSPLFSSVFVGDVSPIP